MCRHVADASRLPFLAEAVRISGAGGIRQACGFNLRMLQRNKMIA